MATLTEALTYLLPGVNFSNPDNKLENVRWDTAVVKPPTQAEVDAAMAQLSRPPTTEQKLAKLGLTVSDLKQALGVKE